jgi:hypothetical protein
MRSLVLGIAAASVLSGGVSLAQTTSGTGHGPGSTTTAPATTAPANRSPGAVGPSGTAAPHQGDAAAASGNNNQAVATTSANAPMPAKGANSFTSGEAKSRIEKNGFSNVGGLTKDDNGVWRGTAQKGGNQTNVWLDYKGNVGEAK